MKIEASQVTGTSYVVAANEIEALERFAAMTTDVHEMKSDAISDRDYENRYGYREERQEVFKIVVKAEKV